MAHALRKISAPRSSGLQLSAGPARCRAPRPQPVGMRRATPITHVSSPPGPGWKGLPSGAAAAGSRLRSQARAHFLVSTPPHCQGRSSAFSAPIIRDVRPDRRLPEITLTLEGGGPESATEVSARWRGMATPPSPFACRTAPPARRRRRPSRRNSPASSPPCPRPARWWFPAARRCARSASRSGPNGWTFAAPSKPAYPPPSCAAAGSTACASFPNRRLRDPRCCGG